MVLIDCGLVTPFDNDNENDNDNDNEKLLFAQSCTDSKRSITYKHDIIQMTTVEKNGEIKNFGKGAEVKTYVPHVHVDSKFMTRKMSIVVWKCLSHNLYL